MAVFLLAIVALGIGTLVAIVMLKRCRRQQSRSQSYPSLNGKVAIITGANTGIGFETALDLASRDARVILACRNASKGEAAANEIRQRTGNGNVIFKQLDLASLQSIRQFSASMLNEETNLDILINNAGIIDSDGSQTEDGFEMIFGVNHLGHFYLTNLLLDRLKEAPSARIVVMSSKVQWARGGFDFNMVNKFDPWRTGALNKTYIQSKIANVLFTRALAKRLKGTHVTVNAVHPGFVDTQMAANVIERVPTWRKGLVRMIVQLIFKTPRQGAQTSIYCAVSKDLEGVTGKFFSDCQEVVLTSEGLTSDEDAEKLWEISTTLVDSALKS